MKLHAVLAGVPSQARNERCESLLGALDVLLQKDQRISSLSKGQQQRVSLSATLLGEPELLILDEPMSGLDPRGRRLVRDCILDHKKKGGTVFFSSHILPDVESLCDEVAIIAKGRVKAQGPLQRIFQLETIGFEITSSFSIDAALPDQVKDLGQWTAFGDTFTLKVPQTTDIVDVAKKIQTAGGTIVGIETLQPTLEEKMVSLIEESEKEEAE